MVQKITLKRRMRNWACWAVICLGGFTIGRGQTGEVSGSVLDGRLQHPVVGASVHCIGSALGAQTEAQGAFHLSLPSGPQTLVCRYLGYEPDTLQVLVKAGASTTANFFLDERPITLRTLEIQSGKPQGLNLIHRLDVQLRPVASSQELLRMVPGVFIAQHAGGGKAEQIFMRGFDIDHGTDLALTADGMPVNMVSHAHGQGYADMHFLIPETIDRLQIDKGPYAAQQGNLATAGSIDFQTKSALEHNVIKVEAGMYHNYRALAMLKLGGPSRRANAADAYVASEYIYNKGYFESPQNLHRVNLFLKYRKLIGRRNLLTASVSDFRSQWNASGQIPDRAVAQGLITRFGSIDPTEGGRTSRSNANFQLVSQLGQGWQLRQQAYGSHYDFNLYSNFTFFAQDSIHGDQIQQKEDRWLMGYSGTLGKTMKLLGKPLRTEGGVGFRRDMVGTIGLYKTEARSFLGRLQHGAVNETNGFAWWNGKWSVADRLDLAVALRGDVLRFAYDDGMEQNQTRKSLQKAILSPKFNLDYHVNSRLELFARAGSGFHSNDARVVLGANDLQVLPRAIGTDVGATFKPANGMLVQLAVWGLAMEQEFVYVGDAGVVEPSGRSRRVGVDLSMRCQALPWLALDGDLNLAHARGLDDAGISSHIPLAPWITSTGGVTAAFTDRLKGSLRYRYLGSRAADETWDLTAQGYCLLDGAVSYTFESRYTIGVSGVNLLNAKWKEAQFSTTTRLQGEVAEVTEMHYTPGSPVAFKLSLSCNF